MGFNYPFPGPVPPYNNVPIAPQYFQPSVFVISAVALGITTTVTTTEDVNYVIGQEVRLNIPESFGCTQLNQQTGFVISLPAANQVQITINSSQNVDPYISSSATTPAQIVAIGSTNTGQTNSDGLMSQGTYIPGAFQNISPL